MFQKDPVKSTAVLKAGGQRDLRDGHMDTPALIKGWSTQILQERLPFTTISLTAVPIGWFILERKRLNIVRKCMMYVIEE